MEHRNKYDFGLDAFDMLTLLFIYLKLTHAIEWSWLWVLAPQWIFVILLLLSGDLTDNTQTRTNTNRWIPLSKKWPATGEHILITVKWSDDDYEVMEEDWGVLECEVKNGSATETSRAIYGNTIAWMPMPKAYKEKKVWKMKDGRVIND